MKRESKFIKGLSALLCTLTILSAAIVPTSVSVNAANYKIVAKIKTVNTATATIKVSWNINASLSNYIKKQKGGKFRVYYKCESGDGRTRYADSSYNKSSRIIKTASNTNVYAYVVYYNKNNKKVCSSKTVVGRTYKDIPKAVKKHEKLILKGINAYLNELKKTSAKKYKAYSKYNKKALLRLMEAIAVAESGGVNSNLMGINPAYLPKGIKGDTLRYRSAKASASIILRLLAYVKADKNLSDIEKVRIVVQAYNFTGESYIDWLRAKYKGKQTQAAIKKYIATVYPAGASNYLKVVMPYYYITTK